MRSLATVVHQNDSIGDNLFRFVVSNCENLALNPGWWESLPEKQRNDVAAAANHATNVFAPIRGDHLVRGLEDIAGWQFDYVISDFDSN